EVRNPRTDRPLDVPFGDGRIQRRPLPVAEHHLHVRPPAPLVEAPGRKGGMILAQIGPELECAGVELSIDGKADVYGPGTLVHLPAGTVHGYRFCAGGGEMFEMTGQRGHATREL